MRSQRDDSKHDCPSGQVSVSTACSSLVYVVLENCGVRGVLRINVVNEFSSSEHKASLLENLGVNVVQHRGDAADAVDVQLVCAATFDVDAAVLVRRDPRARTTSTTAKRELVRARPRSGR